MKRRPMWCARLVLVGVALLPLGASGQTPPENGNATEQVATVDFTCNAKFTALESGRFYDSNTGHCVDGSGGCSVFQ
jgi:hypothetical protein